jgi:eukaryotic-like serine/threonine-protein kinase
MVIGACAFAGASTADTLGAVIHAQPKAPSALIPHVPSDLEKVILRCLRKDPDRRYQHMADVKVALQDIRDDTQSASAAAVSPSSHRRRWVGAGLAGILTLIAATALLLLRSHEGTDTPTPRVVPLTALSGIEAFPALSPDGNQVAFAWSGEKNDNWDLYLKFVGSPEIRRLTTDPLNDVYPRWSPDGRYIAFIRCQPDTMEAKQQLKQAGECQLRLISVMGGPDSKVSDFRFAWGQLDWSPDGRFIVAGISQELATAQPAGLYLLPVASGTPRRLTTPKVVTDQARILTGRTSTGVCVV